MSVQGCLTVNGQMSLIDPQPRTMDVYYSMPDEPNEKTGLLVLVPGFGANCNSNVYQKMRRVFADRYNLYVIQCEYFGSKFMQSPTTRNLVEFADSIPREIVSNFSDDPESNYNLLDGLTLRSIVRLGETKSDYAEMGVVQATDLLISIKEFINFLETENKPVNRKCIIGYGNSHGAYLLYLCNGLMPNCFSDIIDVSAWLYPAYINKPRFHFSITGSFPYITYETEYRYLISKMTIDSEIYDLNEYYKGINNITQIYSFHGTDDELIPLEEKIAFLSGITNSSIEVIGKNRVDNMIFKSTTHGVGADFLKLFDYVMCRYGVLTSERERVVLKFEDVVFSSSMNTYRIGIDIKNAGIQLRIL